jgi:hypothetical protein
LGDDTQILDETQEALSIILIGWQAAKNDAFGKFQPHAGIVCVGYYLYAGRQANTATGIKSPKLLLRHFTVCPTIGFCPSFSSTR